MVSFVAFLQLSSSKSRFPPAHGHLTIAFWTRLPELCRSWLGCRRDKHRAKLFAWCWGQNTGGANDPTETDCNGWSRGDRYRRRCKLSFGNGNRNVPKPLEWCHHRSAARRSPATRPLHRPGNGLPRLGGQRRRQRRQPVRQNRGHWYELRHFARDRSSGAIALGAGLELLGCDLLGLGGASLLYLHNVRR